MAKSKAVSTTPVERARQFLETHEGLRDIRLYTLLLFNAFDETMRICLAWRLGCTEDDLPGAARNNASLLFDFALAGLPEERKHARLFAEARNAVAHRFHDRAYAEKLEEFVRAATKKPWPSRMTDQLRSLVYAVWQLSISVTSEMDRLQERSDPPFPEIPHVLRFGA